jgi:hypothetical protein
LEIKGEIMNSDKQSQLIGNDSLPQSNERITRWHLIPNWNEKKKTERLQAMARQGWHLEKIHPFHNIFRRGEPADMVYRLDFTAPFWRRDKQEYLQLFRDAGWEHVGRFARWQYFRKLQRPGESNEIYSDSAGHIDKYKRIVVVLLVVLVFNLGNMIATFERKLSLRLIHGVYALIFLLLGVALWQVIGQINRLRRELRRKL